MKTNEKKCAAVEMRENQWKFGFHFSHCMNWNYSIELTLPFFYYPVVVCSSHGSIWTVQMHAAAQMHFYSANGLSTFGMAKTHLMANNKANTGEWEKEKEMDGRDEMIVRMTLHFTSHWNDIEWFNAQAMKRQILIQFPFGKNGTAANKWR